MHKETVITYLESVMCQLWNYLEGRQCYVLLSIKGNPVIL